MSTRYPQLANLMASYFHQDAYLDDLDDRGIVDQFRRFSDNDTVQRTIGEISDLLCLPDDDLLNTFVGETGPHDISVADDGAALREWLTMIWATLARP